MKTKKCIKCNADINIYASKCPYCKCSNQGLEDEIPSSLNLDFFSLSLYQSTIDEIANGYVSKYGKPDRILDTTYFAVEENHFYHRFMFFGEAKRLVFISPDKQIILPYSQINGYDIIDNSFHTGGAESAVTTTNTGSILGRAAVGAVVGGATGAIIGGTTASKTTIFEREELTKNVRLSIVIKTKSISNPLIEIDFEEHKDTLQQLVAILDIILSNQAEYATDKDSQIEEKDIYLQEEIRKNHPEIVSEELEREKERKAKVDGNSGCMLILLIPLVIGGLSYFLL